MAFSRKPFRRSRSVRKLETRAHANRAYKRVVRQWELSFNIHCQIVQQDPGADCPNGGQIILMSNAQLQGNAAAAAAGLYGFNDAVRIRRISGNLYFRPENSLVAPTVPNVGCGDLVGDQANHQVYMRMGLSKSRGPQSQAGVPDALNPLNNGATPAEIGDYQDGRWMKMWEHFWGASGSVGFGLANNFNCCSVQDGYIVPPTASGSQPTYNVPPIVCEPCGDIESPAVDQSCQFVANTHRWWHCPIRYGRPIVLKESDHLTLYFGWERLRDVADAARLVQPPMKFFGGCRLLLES